MFHVDAEGLTVQDGTHRTHTTYTTHENPNLTILPLGLEAKVISGQEKPIVQGWIIQSGYTMRPLPTAVFSREASGPASMAYVLYPTAAGSECPITSIEPLQIANALGIAIHFANGRTDYFVQADAPSKVPFMDYETDGQAAYIRVEGGKVVKALMAGGTKITQSGKALPAEVLEITDLSQTQMTHRF